MTNIQHKETAHEAKPDLFAGIDVGAEELILVIRKNGKPFDPQKFANTPADRARLVKKLIKLPGIIVCMEATGVYHFDLAIALHDAGVLLMVALNAFFVAAEFAIVKVRGRHIEDLARRGSGPAQPDGGAAPRGRAPAGAARERASRRHPARARRPLPGDV